MPNEQAVDLAGRRGWGKDRWLAIQRCFKRHKALSDSLACPPEPRRPIGDGSRLFGYSSDTSGAGAIPVGQAAPQFPSEGSPSLTPVPPMPQ